MENEPGSGGGQTLCLGCDGTVTPVPKSLLLRGARSSGSVSDTTSALRRHESSDSCWRVMKFGAGREDASRPRRDRGHVKHDIREFVDAVLALSDDPGPANLQRYLAVSQELEESRRPRQSAAQEVRARPRDRGTRPRRAEAAKADA